MSDWFPENDGAYRAEMAAMYPTANRRRIKELEAKLAKASELETERDALKAEVKRLRDALDDANSIIAFQEAKLEAYEEMAPPRDPDLLRKRLDEIKAIKGKKDD